MGIRHRNSWSCIRQNQTRKPNLWQKRLPGTRAGLILLNGLNSGGIPPKHRFIHTFFKRAIPWPEHPEFGAFHTGDVIYWFNNLKMLDRPWTEGDKALAEAASSYWVNFVTSGDPNGEGLPEWPAFNADKKETQELDLETSTIPVASPEKIEFFSGLGNTP